MYLYFCIMRTNCCGSVSVRSRFLETTDYIPTTDIIKRFLLTSITINLTWRHEKQHCAHWGWTLQIIIGKHTNSYMYTGINIHISTMACLQLQIEDNITCQKLEKILRWNTLKVFWLLQMYLKYSRKYCTKNVFKIQKQKYCNVF